MRHLVKGLILCLAFSSLPLYGQDQGGAETSASLNPESNQIQIILVPRTQSTLSSQISGKVKKINFLDGESFKQDDILIEFDCEVLKTDRDKAKAELFAAEKRLIANTRLNELASISKLEYQISKAEHDKAKAEYSRITTILKLCEVRAPFNGRVVEKLVNTHESVADGKELIKILDDSSLKIEMFVPSKWLLWLNKGTKFNVNIEETGLSYPATIKTIGASIDPVSQSLKVVGYLDESHPELIAGMGGQAVFKVPE